MAFVAIFLRLLILAIWLLVLGRVLWSWVDPRYGSPAGRFLFQATEPLLAPIRQLLPRTGMIDLSPLVLMIALTVLVRVIVVS